MHFLQGPLKMYILYANRFLYTLRKKSRNKLCLEPHYKYVLFRMFFSHMNNKRFFVQVSDPLKVQITSMRSVGGKPLSNLTPPLGVYPHQPLLHIFKSH